MQELYTLKQVASALKTTLQTLYALRRAGKLSFVKIGNRNRVTEEEYRRFVRENTTTK